MTYRVIQWATGGVGRAAIEGVLRHPDLELVGCWVHSEEKSGHDVGELVGIEPIGVRATTSMDEVLALDADCVVYAPLLPVEDEVAAILRSGKNVVTPVGWVYPADDQARAIRDACAAGRTTLHGSGIHPGGITEWFPLCVSGVVSAATYVRAEEFSDIRTYGAPDVVRHIMGFGMSPDEALASPLASLLEGGFKRSVQMVVDALGFATDGTVTTAQEVAVAAAPIDSPIGVIEPGQVAARRFRWDARVGDQVVVTAAVNWLMGDEDLDPDWSLGDAGERFEVEVRGDPSVTLTFKGLQPETVEAGLVRNEGVVATAMHCINAIPLVCDAEPGIKTYLDLPVVTGRAAPSLGAGRVA
ncbi:hypothetical protein [Nocardioides panacisoli]|uniref:Dihydrodipicolinate reductase n=1 Tax=Nocardioides panacisoli TaxID=627624 RepID=A0ABP7I7D0_9ACTN